MKSKKISLAFVFMMVLVTFASTIFAVTGSIIDTTQKGSLTITTREQNNGSTATTTAPVISGVTYALYRVDTVDGTTVTTTAQAETAIASLSPVSTQTTAANTGVASFTNLDLGRYYAKVTDYPTGSSQVPESFLVNIPMTNVAGTGWIYNVTVEPKVKTARGNVVLTKQDANNNNAALSGVVFTVQVSTDNCATWTDYVPEGASTALTLTTGAAGTVSLNDYPITIGGNQAYYRFVETSVTNDEYVIDNSHLDYVYAQADGKSIVVHNGTAAAAATTGAITVTNEKPVLTKTVKNDDESYTTQASVSATDTVSFKVNATVPANMANMTTFTLVDTLPAGLKNRANVVVKGISGGTATTLTLDEDYTKSESGNALTVTLVPAEIKDYDSIEVTYDAELDMTNAVIGSAGNVSPVTLTYTNNVNTSGAQASTKTIQAQATVLTGGVKIHKVNASEESLDGAKFKIATSQANAVAGTFVKGTDGNDIEVTTATTTGLATINGLAYEDDGTARNYWLVETQAPTYTDGGETKAYTLLTAPVQVTVDGTSHNSEVKVVNRKPFELPLTGGIGTMIFVVVGAAFVIVSKTMKKEVKE